MQPPLHSAQRNMGRLGAVVEMACPTSLYYPFRTKHTRKLPQSLFSLCFVMQQLLHLSGRNKQVILLVTTKYKNKAAIMKVAL